MDIRSAARWILGAAALTAFTALLPAQMLVHKYMGRVVMEDGSVPPKRVLIEQICQGPRTILATTEKNGEYSWSEEVNIVANREAKGCIWRAYLKGYESTELSKLGYGRLPDLVLRPVKPPEKKDKDK